MASNNFSSKSQTSSIAMALAGKTASVDIPKPRAADAAATAADWATEAAAVAAATAASSAIAMSIHGSGEKHNHRRRGGAGLPTPPNSISPSLPPQQVFKDREHSTPPTPPGGGLHGGADSDIDLQDAVEHAAAQDTPRHRLDAHGGDSSVGGSNGFAAGSSNSGSPVPHITPSVLAAQHLPAILLSHGPLAIRHIMGYLSQSVPGFSRIPAAKARRLVVGALEGRSGSGTDTEEVVFEKVGWGRWDARQKRSGAGGAGARRPSPVAVRHAHSHHGYGVGGPMRSPSPYATRSLRIPHRTRPAAGERKVSSHSLAFSHQSKGAGGVGGGFDAERMSMDGGKRSGGSDEDDDGDLDRDSEGMDEDDAPSDVTDEEDWANIGAAALRSGSFAKEMLHTRPGKRLDPEERARRTDGAYPGRRTPSSGLASSAPGFREKVGGWMANSTVAGQPAASDEDLMQGVGKDESDAVRALLQMGSI